jgi:hypothetical protein
MMALETDVLALREDWLGWFLHHLRPQDYAVGAWHHEQFVNPSCTLYRADVLRDMLAWCRRLPDKYHLRWGPDFGVAGPLDRNYPAHFVDEFDKMVSWICGPFAEKRGFPAGTSLKEPPSGQMKGPGWYEPGQQLHAWAVNEGHSYTVCPNATNLGPDGNPYQTVYGGDGSDPRRQLEVDELLSGGGRTAHLWGGTRALDVIKHEVNCGFVREKTPGWLAREARFWRALVPPDVQRQTLDLIRKYGWHYTGAGTPSVTDRDHEAVMFVRDCYRQGGVEW